MEWFVPSLLVLVLGAIICIFIMPRMSPYTLGITSVLLFALGIWHHYSMFPYEYPGQYPIKEVFKDYSGFIMIIAVIISGVIGVMVMYGGSPPAIATILPASIIPNIAMPNIAMPNLGMRPANNASKSIFNLGGIANNSKRPNIASTSFKVV